MKPAFVVLAAWAFSESGRRPEMPATMLAFAMLFTCIPLLILQPDFGQTMLLSITWGALFFLAGLRWMWTAGFLGAAFVGVFGAYKFIPHVTSRLQRFLDPASGDTFQIDTSLESFMRGGWFGRGPGEGTVKRILPDSHTDFIFAVAAEEFGIILCLIILALFSFIVIRSLRHAMREQDAFTRLAISGLALLFGLQSAIAMAVSLYLMPSKGMTLPFVSYGGSSLISLALGMGMLIALTRRRPQARVDAEQPAPNFYAESLAR
jgi:cell division protein FtsW